MLWLVTLDTAWHGTDTTMVTIYAVRSPRVAKDGGCIFFFLLLLLLLLLLFAGAALYRSCFCTPGDGKRFCGTLYLTRASSQKFLESPCILEKTRVVSLR